MAIDHDTVTTRLGAILQGIATPSFNAVYPGEPLGLPVGDRYAAFWYLGRGIGTRSGESTLSNAMITEQWHIECWWLRQPERASFEAWEVEIADADQGIQTAIRADSQLGGACSDSWVTDSNVGYKSFPLGPQPNALYRSLAMQLNLEDLEGEAINP